MTSDPSCWTCDPIKLYLQQAEGYVGKIGEAMQDPMLALFGVLVSLWLTIFFSKALLTKVIDWPKFSVNVALILLSYGLLSSQTTLIEGVYRGSLATMGAAGSVAFKVGSGESITTSDGIKGFETLTKEGEKAMTSIIQVAAGIVKNASWNEIKPYFIALALIIPYFILIVMYLSQVAVTVFSVMMIATFSPFLLMAMAFDWGRGMAFTGIKTLLGLGMALFGSTAALGFIIYGVTSAGLGEGGDKATALMGGDTNLSDGPLLIAVALGLMGTAFQQRATEIANSITGSMLSSSAAAIITAGATGMAAAGAALAFKPAGMAAKGLGYLAGKAAEGGAGGAMGRAGQLLEKFHNINQGLSGGVNQAATEARRGGQS